MRWHWLRYINTFLLPILAGLAFVLEGGWSFLPVIQGFVIIPITEFFLKPDPSNVPDNHKAQLLEDKMFDYLLWFLVPLQIGMLAWFFFVIQGTEFLSLTWLGRVFSMGMLCGIYGINVAHELGHRQTRLEKALSKMLLLTSLYMHFFIEHNYGHHKNVGTPEDGATAKFKEALQVFWFRSIWKSYQSAWHIQMQWLKKKRRPFLSPKNEMLIYTFLQMGLVALVFVIFGVQVLWGFLGASLIGILLLETVNYVEHYGLARRRISEHRYENTSVEHSWNSDHVLGRRFLFELSRHSDHHAAPHKKYQVLDSHENSPQLPTGYPGMMLLATVPPLWFWVMNERVRRLTIND